MRLNKGDQVYKEIAYNKNLGITAKDMKRRLAFSNITGVMAELTHRNKTTIREEYEYHQYPDIDKIRVKAFQNLIRLLICLKNILKQKYPNDDGEKLIIRLRDMNPIDIIKGSDIVEVMNISKRTFYDYINTLQMILDYSYY
ncbi:MAG: hypothetical protein ACFFDH_25045 [Promethearchaeota archaeon]